MEFQKALHGEQWNDEKAVLIPKGDLTLPPASDFGRWPSYKFHCETCGLRKDFS
jgi:hypothetical protein